MPCTHLVKLGFKPDLMKTDYLPNAFNYTISNYKNVVFLMFGENDAELRQYLNSHMSSFPSSIRMVIVGPERDRMLGADKKELSLGVDFAVMSMVDVLIMTYGSFGLFAALLTKDKHEVLYPKDHVSHGENGVNRGFTRFTAIPWKVT
ncbi:uncharacterized protein LOC142354538 [Convolutriloba macropyga]|uniref:uncharacterized protein LOC142354538 n=1 Tax=Convolutriloba macropyga TaxID=536237 RepID=UPI003F5228FE